MEKMIFWITKNLATCGQMEGRKLKKEKKEDIEVVKVWDLIDGPQENIGQFKSKVDKVERAIKYGKKVVIACRGGLSRSNAVALAYLVKNGMDFDEAYDMIREKVPVAQIDLGLIDSIKEISKL